MKLSVIINGKVVDFKFQTRSLDTVFKLDDIIVGQIFKIGNAWSSVSAVENLYGPVHGFKTRLSAAIHLWNIWRKYNETI